MSLVIISGLFRGRKIKTLPSFSTRPSSSKCRAAVFNICQTKIENSCFLDLYAGSGAMGIEALSRGASFSIFLENHKKAVRCIEENIALLNIEDKTRIICSDVFSGLKRIKRRADIVYIDPPYEYYGSEGFIEKMLKELLLLSLLNDNCLIFFETPSSFEFSLGQCNFSQIILSSVRRYGFSSLIELSYQS
jgi:16S rRNA (guanine966-N2)-methyltransferase